MNATTLHSLLVIELHRLADGTWTAELDGPIPTMGAGSTARDAAAKALKEYFDVADLTHRKSFAA